MSVLGKSCRFHKFEYFMGIVCYNITKRTTKKEGNHVLCNEQF